MRRHDVPQEDDVGEIELHEHALDDRRSRLARPGARELALGRERDPRDPCATVAGRLSDEQDTRVPRALEVRGQPPPQEQSALAHRVLVEGVADPGGGQVVDECRRRYDCPSVTGSSGSRAERADGSAADPQNLIWVMPAEEGVPEEVVVVVSGGEAPLAEAVRALPAGATVITADSGLDHALALGLDVAVAVGDFDSASPEAVKAAEVAGVRIDRHPAAKDATDLELALDVAIAMAPDRVLVLASRGGRLDHEVSSLLLLASDRYADVQVDAAVGDSYVHVVRVERTLAGEPGELVSLLAVGGPADGVRTGGLAYPLHGETLEPGSTRGVSNVFAESTARVSVERGALLAIRPGSA
jgi:thiamine pyrophosphokinase